MAGALVTPADGCRLRPCRARNAAELSTILPPPQGRRARSSNGPQSRAVSGWPREPPRRGHWPRLAASSPINPAPCFHVSDKAATTRSDDRQAVRHLSALPQAVCYTLCAASLAVWWIWTAHNGAAGALFAATTVAAKPASLLVAVKSAYAGLLAGGLHTLAGADHLAALTPLTIGRSRASSALLGALWGFGHSTGQLLLGLLMVLLKDRFDALMPALSKWGATMVGLTLLAIGILGIYETYFEKNNDHQNDAEVAEIKEKAKAGTSFAMATYATGIVYGLQPDALFVIIPALALPTKAAAAAYIIMFVIGTVMAMGSYTAVIGHTTEAIGEKNPWVTQNLTLVASLIAICIGIVIILPGWGIDIPFSPL